MKLIIGGCYQGKLHYALNQTGVHMGDVSEGADMRPEDAKHARLINHFHLLIKTVMAEGGDATAFAKALCADNPSLVVVADEIGMGVVPIDEFERKWREEVGRALVVVALQSETVDRVICGIGQRIKG